MPPLKKTSPFTKRCLHLCIGVGILVCTVAWRLVSLQIVDEERNGERAERDCIEFEVLPAQRGLIMDRNEEILTNNILYSELVADRYHLRDPKMVCWGLAYSMASHQEEWKDMDGTQRTTLIRMTYKALLANASIKKDDLSEYRKAAQEVDEGAKGAMQMLKEQFDEKIVAEYCEAHDKLVAELLAPYLNLSEEEILDKIQQNDREKKIQNIVLVQNLTEEKAEEINEMLTRARIHGFKCQSNLRRSYVSPESLAHVLGFVNRDNKGMEGVEAKFDSYLTGQPGSREYRRDARGLRLPCAEDRLHPPVHGMNVKLTIDMKLQAIVEEELLKGLTHFRAPRGCIILVEPKTGDILALASFPTYNLNTKENRQLLQFDLETKPEDKDRLAALNYAVQGNYEPGSTFKVIAATSALDNGKATLNTPINCTPVVVPGAKNPVSDTPRYYSGLKFYEVLKKSSNPGAYRIGLLSGWKLYKQYLERYGIGKTTGIELPGASAGLITDGNNLVNFSRITYGYSVNVTPLHMAMVYAAIANDGVRMKPRLVKSIYNADGSEYVGNKEFEPKAVCTVMKPKTAKDLRQALWTVTQEGGTARRAHIPGYHVGGKTGTAHKVQNGGGYREGRYAVSFAGMVPVEDPAFVCLVVVDDPRPTDCKAGGGSVCAPIFKAVATRALRAMNIAPADPAEAEKAEKAAAAAIASGASTSNPPVKLSSVSPSTKKAASSSSRKSSVKSNAPSSSKVKKPAASSSSRRSASAQQRKKTATR
ncbi:peptidoglycan D,D-transpeptidase FtsI family protein [Akkermansia glycaniphila]|uniref:Beta-lactamase/transpeptidase-like n=1 Tax=Akkermansia glycaniphila TaxID=1679444 RepID=A0A1H6L0C0_9BACT|nr:penicillin-binding protein 2 [Akkermansia glycaniphila]SEH81560.1 beta-lactamase/transpeptidase-like [Akkermansia glycaniphila]